MNEKIKTEFSAVSMYPSEKVNNLLKKREELSAQLNNELIDILHSEKPNQTFNHDTFDKKKEKAFIESEQKRWKGNKEPLIHMGSKNHALRRMQHQNNKISILQTLRTRTKMLHPFV